MIFESEPKNFNPRFEIVSCFCQMDKKILLLHRQDNKAQGNTWGVPAGKIEKDEEIFAAMARELMEETGINLPREELAYFKKLYIRYEDYDFVYHIFHAALTQGKEVAINKEEHKKFRWVSTTDALKMNLIEDLDKCIKIFFR